MQRQIDGDRPGWKIGCARGRGGFTSQCHLRNGAHVVIKDALAGHAGARHFARVVADISGEMNDAPGAFRRRRQRTRRQHQT
ncbi:hypothetical protein D3C72_1623780 [compost metagenome]